MDIPGTMRRLGGVAPTGALRALGVARRGIASAVDRGDLVRLRRGWYALPGLDESTRAAVRAGGVVTCITRLAALGVWVAPGRQLPHVAVPRSSTGRLPRKGIVVHSAREVTRVGSAGDSAVGALRHYARCFGPEFAVAAADSALRLGLLWEWEIGRLPAEVRRRVDPRCESGGESIVRQRLQARRIALEVQPVLPGVGRVDFVIGDRLVLEVDGYAHHGTREDFERDRARDLAAVESGRIVIRVSQRQVLGEWPRIERAVLAIVRSGRHRWPRRAQ